MPTMPTSSPCPVQIRLAIPWLPRPGEDEPGARWRIHPVAQEEARVGRLVVPDVLPGYAEPVLRVVHEGVQPVIGRDCGRVDPQLAVVRRPPDPLLPPVAQDVRTQARRRLRPVV